MTNTEHTVNINQRGETGDPHTVEIRVDGTLVAGIVNDKIEGDPTFVLWSADGDNILMISLAKLVATGEAEVRIEQPNAVSRFV